MKRVGIRFSLELLSHCSALVRGGNANQDMEIDDTIPALSDLESERNTNSLSLTAECY